MNRKIVYLALVVVIASVLALTIGGLAGSGGNNVGPYPVESSDVGPGEKAILGFQGETGIDVYE
jgi:hypothetical protein